jgi:hypothetical protein
LRFSFKLLCVVGLLASGTLSAAILSGGITETLDLPGYSSSGPRVVANPTISFPSAGPHLTGANEVSNPSGWGDMLDASFDSSTNIFSLFASASNSYQIITVVFDNLTFDNGDVVTGINVLSSGNAVVENLVGVVLSTSFTSNSITIQYALSDMTIGNYFLIEPASDTFQILTGPGGGSSIPEPSTWGLAAAGLLAGCYFKRKR